MFLFLLLSSSSALPLSSFLQSNYLFYRDIFEPLLSHQFLRITASSLDKKCKYFDLKSICQGPSANCALCYCEPTGVLTNYSNTLLTTNNEVDRSLSSSVKNRWVELPSEPNCTLVDLEKNREGYTGYRGAKIWSLIYAVGCPLGEKAPCEEDRLLYKLISGLQASVSCHVGDTLPGSAAERKRFLGSQLLDWDERVDNLLFLYCFLLKAVHRLDQFEAEGLSGVLRKNLFNGEENDPTAVGAVEKLKSERAFQRLQNLGQAFFNMGFEGLFGDKDILKYKKSFREVLEIINCVECEKCKLWGKLQVTGIGTAMKINFDGEMKDLTRLEIHTLLRTFFKTSNSLNVVYKYSFEDAGFEHGKKIVFTMAVLMVAVFLLRRRSVRKNVNR